MGDQGNVSDKLAEEVEALRRLLDGELTEDAEDLVREQYSRLLEQFGGDSAALSIIRPIGAAIQERVDRGEMSRAFVRRSGSRRKR